MIFGTTPFGVSVFGNSSSVGGATIEGACVFALQGSFATTKTAIIEATNVYALSIDQLEQAVSSLQAAITYAKLLFDAYTTGSVIAGDVTLNVSLSEIQTAAAIFNAATTFSNIQAVSDGSTGNLNAQQQFSISDGLTVDNIATFESDITFGVSEDFEAAGTVIPGTGLVEAEASFGILQNFASSTSGSIFNNSLQVGLISSIDSLTIANLFAASTLDTQLALTVNGGNVIEAAIAYAIEHAEIQTVGISLEGSLGLAIEQAILNTSSSELNATVTLSHQAALQSVATAILNAGLPLSAISGITTNGAILSLTLTLPCGRTVLVQAENRTLSISAEIRTTTIQGDCN